MQLERWLMCILHSARHMTVKVAHCPYQDTLPLSKFQMEKHFLAQIFCLKEADICICRMRNTERQGNTGGI